MRSYFLKLRSVARKDKSVDNCTSQLLLALIPPHTNRLWWLPGSWFHWLTQECWRPQSYGSETSQGSFYGVFPTAEVTSDLGEFPWKLEGREHCERMPLNLLPTVDVKKANKPHRFHGVNTGCHGEELSCLIPSIVHARCFKMHL